MRSRTHGLASFVVLVGLMSAGCARTSTTPPPAAQPEQAVADDIAAVERELDARELELTDLGIALPLAELESPVTEDEDAADEAPEHTAPSEPSSSADGAAPSAPSESTQAESTQAGRSPTTKRVQARSAARSRCERICDLAQATCELSERVCALAAQHADDPRYRDACARADDQCQASSGACAACRDD